MKDEQFGELKWDGSDRWDAQVTFPRFREFGAALDVEDPPEPNPSVDETISERQRDARAQLEHYLKTLSADEQEQYAALLNSLRREADGSNAARKTAADEKRKRQAEAEAARYRSGVREVGIETTGRRSKPTPAQRAAWAKLLERGDALWDELTAAALVVYRRQRPMREKVYRRTYGDHLLDRRLPVITTAAEMRQHIRPVMFRIPPAEKGAATADVKLHVAATWDVDGLGVIIRDGRIVEVMQVMDMVQERGSRRRETIGHPTFGTLRRIPDDDPWEVIDQWQAPREPGESGFDHVKRGGPWPWEGRARFDAFLEYAWVADRRAEFTHNRANAERPGSRVAWDFADGEFDLRVYAGRGEQPVAAQAQAFERFRAQQDALASEMIDTIFAQYRETFDARRRNYKDRYVEEVIPQLDGADGLRDLMQLRHIHVHEPDAAGRVAIAMQFVCTWDYDGFTAIWRDGLIAEWGEWKDARPGEATTP